MRELARQKINWLAVFIPLAFAIYYVPAWQNELLLFWCSVLGLIVTSAWIGSATEQLAGRIGPTWGGMMNAGFGNLPELIFGLIAIRNGLGSLAKAAWTGAIVSNILVVNGAAMVVAGLRFGRVRFEMERAQDAGASLISRPSPYCCRRSTPPLACSCRRRRCPLTMWRKSPSVCASS